MVSRSEILRVLPPVQGKRDVIADNQDTKDIIREVLEAHQVFAPDYDKIAGTFHAGLNEDLYQDLFDFCKKNVRYRIEPEAMQTTRSPAALLGIGSGDCKHYAGFIGGILDAQNRKGNNVNWKYRFASYDVFDSSPQHVFVVVDDNGKEIWIDPVLGSFNSRAVRPAFKYDKKAPKMLQRIYGLPSVGAASAADIAAAIVKNFQTGAFYFSQIYGQGATLPDIKFFVDGDPYLLPIPAHLLREQGKSSQIIPPPQGLTVQYPATWRGYTVRPDMLRPTITVNREMIIAQPDGTLYDFKGQGNGGSNAILIANNNLLLDLLVAATGAIQLAFQPYPDAENKQRFYDSILRLRDMNFMNAREIKTVIGSALDGLNNAIQAVGKGFVKFIGIIPRQAFLLLVKLNVADMAKNMDKNLQVPANANDIKKKWEGFGGDFGVLVNNVNQGKGKNRIFGFEDPSHTIGSVDGIGELTVAAALASAAPIIAMLAKFLKGIGGPEVDKLVDQAVTKMNTILVAAGEDPIAVAQSTTNGVPVIVTDKDGNQITIPPNPSGMGKGVISWIENNPVIAGGVAVAGGLIIMKASKKKGAVRRRTKK